jgi:hypothetical protein
MTEFPLPTDPATFVPDRFADQVMLECAMEFVKSRHTAA